MPSAVSAIKVDGERAYERVRAGEDVAARRRGRSPSAGSTRSPSAGIDELLDVDVEVTCAPAPTSGRSPATSARRCGVGGHLIALRRTRVGPFELRAARTLDELAALDDPVTVPLAGAVRASMPVRQVDAAEPRELSTAEPSRRWVSLACTARLPPTAASLALLREDGDPPAARPVLVFDPRLTAPTFR